MHRWVMKLTPNVICFADWRQISPIGARPRLVMAHWTECPMLCPVVTHPFQHRYASLSERCKCLRTALFHSVQMRVLQYRFLFRYWTLISSNSGLLRQVKVQKFGCPAIDWIEAQHCEDFNIVVNWFIIIWSHSYIPLKWMHIDIIAVMFMPTGNIRFSGAHVSPYGDGIFWKLVWCAKWKLNFSEFGNGSSIRYVLVLNFCLPNQARLCWSWERSTLSKPV